MTSVLVVNSGSSSLKYQLLDPSTEAVHARGLVERIGSPGGRMRRGVADDAVETEVDVPDHEAALRLMLRHLEEVPSRLDDLVAVGHRAVHGGAAYSGPTIYDAAVDATIEALVPLAPLHNPATLIGLRALSALLPQVPHVVVFDTAFHATLPPEAATYALPRELAERHQIRRYGFHGTSYAYVARTAPALLGRPADDTNLIVCHLGNGASIAAMRGGRSIDTSMGMTPMGGLAMGTRSGDLDPAVVLHLARSGRMSLDEIEDCLTRQSGLKGISGRADMRETRALAEAGDSAARLAIDVYTYRIRSCIGAYLALLPTVHALVFTAGIGENDPDLRAEVCRPLEHLGIKLDAGRNATTCHEPRRIDDESTALAVWVVPTNEEAEIARQAAALLALAERRDHAARETKEVSTPFA